MISTKVLKSGPYGPGLIKNVYEGRCANNGDTEGQATSMLLKNLCRGSKAGRGRKGKILIFR